MTCRPTRRQKQLGAPDSMIEKKSHMNFFELCKLHAQHGGEREAIAKALGLTPEQIDEMQREAERIASELTPTPN
jgi:hypothetical protein